MSNPVGTDRKPATAPRRRLAKPGTNVRKTSPGRPRAAEADARLAHLMDVATHEFLTHGYGEANIARIATTAGISKKTIYARYANKDELLLAVLSSLARPAQTTMALDLALPIADPEPALVAIALHMASGWTAKREIGVYRLVSAEAARFPGLADILQETMKPLRAILNDYFKVQCARGVLRIDDVEATTRLFAFMTIGEIRERALFGHPPQSSEIDVMVRRGVRLFLQGCRAR